MQIRKYAATAALSIAAIGVSAGTVYADPVTDAASQTINYHLDVSDTSASITTDGGSLVDDNGVLEVKGDNGVTGAAVPLSFRVDDFTFPIAARITGNTATLTPLYDIAHATYAPVSDDVKTTLPADATVNDIDLNLNLPNQDQAPWKTAWDREQSAWTRLIQTLTVGSILGVLAGAGLGGAIGCALGAGIGGAGLGAFTVLLAAPLGVIGGCVAGIAAVGALGTFLGQIVVTLPIAAVGIAQYFSIVNSPFVPAGGK